MNFFDEKMATSYDERFARLAPFRDALQLTTRMILSGLPARASLLCVGAGTGAEVLSLGKVNPEWQFTLVEPAPAMLAVARHKCDEAGLSPRCTFHEGFLDSLPEGPPFSAATALLVSQFVTDREQRREFFAAIARRLEPGGPLVSADLSVDGTARELLWDTWLKLLEYNGSTPEQLEAYKAACNKDFVVSDTREIEDLIESAGFERPFRFLQTVLIQGFAARRKP